MSASDDQTRLRHMLDAAWKVIAFTQYESRESLERDEKLHLALVRLIEIIGEAASRLSDTFRDTHPDIPWAAIIGMRNRLIHAYFSVDLDRVRDTVTVAIPALAGRLEVMIAIDRSAGEDTVPPDGTTDPANSHPAHSRHRSAGQ
jgi:uncharacterized protein with HEPN domain